MLGVTQNETVPQAYIDKNLPMINGRITLGGYRLAYQMSYIFGTGAIKAPEVPVAAVESIEEEPTEEEIAAITALVETIFGKEADAAFLQ